MLGAFPACRSHVDGGLAAARTLRNDFVRSLRGPAVGAVAEKLVDPWQRPIFGAELAAAGATLTAAAADDPSDALCAGPYFATDDERQRRVWNL